MAKSTKPAAEKEAAKAAKAAEKEAAKDVVDTKAPEEVTLQMVRDKATELISISKDYAKHLEANKKSADRFHHANRQVERLINTNFIN